MSKSVKKNFAYTVIKANEKGFTLLSMLMTVALISLTIPLLMSIIYVIPDPMNDETSSIYHFFYFLRDDLLFATNYSIDNNILFLELPSGEIATIEKYGSLIRRQVDRKGHEIYVRDVKDLIFKHHPYGIRVMITSMQGEIYEKTIVFYE